MEGFIRLRIPLWAQIGDTFAFRNSRLDFTIIYHGDEAKIEDLLTFSQVFLSIALPFAVIPLVMFTSSKKVMGEFANHAWIKYVAWIVTAVLIVLDVYLLGQQLGGMFS